MTRKGLLALGLVVFAAGCDGEDAERLARVGRKVNEKFHSLTGGPQEKLSSGWLAMRSNFDDTTLDTRVAVRLRFDKALETASIHVSTVSEGTVELKGKVTDLNQRRRAVEVAQSTVGVNEVRDSLLADDKK
jgi:osmotically-inducible protein OsmY